MGLWHRWANNMVYNSNRKFPIYIKTFDEVDTGFYVTLTYAECDCNCAQSHLLVRLQIVCQRTTSPHIRGDETKIVVGDPDTIISHRNSNDEKSEPLVNQLKVTWNYHLIIFSSMCVKFVSVFCICLTGRDASILIKSLKIISSNLSNEIISLFICTYTCQQS